MSVEAVSRVFGEREVVEKSYDLVVIGGGISGVCAAIAAARHGAKTALIHNRPVLGGNASSEVRMHICGASRMGGVKDVRETGIMDEILLRNKVRNPNQSFSVFDNVLWEMTHYQEGLDLFLNTHIDEVMTQDQRILAVKGTQQTTEEEFLFRGSLFADTTGDGFVAAAAGAEFMVGREGKDIFGEAHAPDVSDHYTMGNSLMFTSKDMGYPVPFKKPEWANTYRDEDFIHRPHDEVSAGYWWIELGGEDEDIIKDGEVIRDELLKTLYGIWDHIKNSGHHDDAKNLALDWVQCLPGKRDSRRIVGDYILKEEDLISCKVFEDAIAYGGWSLDMHCVGGMVSKAPPTIHFKSDDVYTIPYGCIYSKDVENLYVGGRAISSSHLAFGSTRVIATCGVVGQAVGTAAALAIEKEVMPRGLKDSIIELQQRLIQDDCYIPGVELEAKNNLTKIATITASSEQVKYEAQKVTSGIARRVHQESHMWKSNGIAPKGEWISFRFDHQPVRINNLMIKFDSDLSAKLMPSLREFHTKSQVKILPLELVKDYSIECYKDQEKVYEVAIKDNGLRLNKHELDGIICDELRITVIDTYGCENAHIFEVAMY